MAPIPPLPGSIIGIVLDKNNEPMSNVSVTLIGGLGPQVLLTDTSGIFAFNDLLPGDYKLVAVHNQSNDFINKLVRVEAGKDYTGLNLTMVPSSAVNVEKDNRYLPLKYLQYVFLGIIGYFFFYNLLAKNITNLSLTDLKDIENARGIITYLVAVTTVAMAAILMLTAIMTGGKDLDKRFALGKEILTLLIGVLGTIIGFYYGASAKSETGSTGVGSSNTNVIKISEVRIEPQTLESGKNFILSTNLTGGTNPYTYSISFTPVNSVSSVTNKVSSSGKISDTLKVAPTTKGGTSITYLLLVKDKSNREVSSTGQLRVKE